MPSEHICYHERLRPTEWNQPKPEACAMVPYEDYLRHTIYYCPICDWGWDSPDAPEQAMTRMIRKAAEAVFAKEDVNANAG